MILFQSRKISPDSVFTILNLNKYFRLSGYFVFFDILTICGAVVVVLFFHNIRIIIHKIAKEKTEQIAKTKKRSPIYQLLSIKR